MKRVVSIGLFSVVCLSAIWAFARQKTAPKQVEVLHDDKVTLRDKATFWQVFRHKLIGISSYAQNNNYSPKYALLADFRIRSSRKRMFLVNLETKKILAAGLVTHGHCQKYDIEEAEFSNEIGSNCSSSGKYRIGAKYSGKFGKSFRLHGLENSNSNAYRRFIVLHAHSCVPDNDEKYGICFSEGCPTVSPQFLEKIEPYIESSNMQMLLWIYS